MYGIKNILAYLENTKPPIRQGWNLQQLYPLPIWVLVTAPISATGRLYFLYTHTHTHTHTLHHSHDYVPGELQLGNIETKENIAYGPITACNPQQSDPDAEYEEIPNEAQPHIELQENPAYRSV